MRSFTKKERREIMLDMICATIQIKDYEALKVLFCGYCHLVGYNHSRGMITGGMLPDDTYRGLVADYCEGVGLFDWR